MLVLNEEQIRSLAKPDQVIAAIRKAFARDFHASLKMPARTSLEAGSSILLLMPCYDSELNAAGVKTITVNPQEGIHATYTLIDPATGAILALMEANYLTDLRTAATSALATDLLARRDSHTLGIFGSGRQAQAHFAVLPAVHRFSRLLVCGSGRSDLTGFCRTMQREHGLKIESVDAATCARESDVLCTCTTAAEPLFDGRLLKPGTHLNLVGAFQPHAREVDDTTVVRSRVVVDTYEGALQEAGDLLIPLANGSISRGHIIADLQQVACGEKQGRTADDQTTLFKSVGCALEDLAAAQLILEAYRAKP